MSFNYFDGTKQRIDTFDFFDFQLFKPDEDFKNTFAAVGYILKQFYSGKESCRFHMDSTYLKQAYDGNKQEFLNDLVHGFHTFVPDNINLNPELQDNHVTVTFSTSFPDQQSKWAESLRIAQEIVDNMLKQMGSEQWNDLKKAKYLLEAMLDINFDYNSNYIRDPGADHGQLAYCVFVYKKAVCAGISRAYQMLCCLAGLRVTSINGYITGGGPHGWNILLTEDHPFGIYIDPSMAMARKQAGQTPIDLYCWKDREQKDMTGYVAVEVQHDMIRYFLTRDPSKEEPYIYRTKDLDDLKLEYQVHVKEKGWLSVVSDNEQAGTVGEYRRMEAIRIQLKGAPFYAGIRYQVHVKEKGWLPAVSNNEQAGTVGEYRRMEAIKIELTNLPEYSVCYTVHLRTLGWVREQKDNALAGTVGEHRRMEAIKIRAVRKRNL